MVLALRRRVAITWLGVLRPSALDRQQAAKRLESRALQMECSLGGGGCLIIHQPGGDDNVIWGVTRPCGEGIL